MKAYFEYDDETFWAICTRGKACYTVTENRYYNLAPYLLFKVGTEDQKYWSIPESAKRTEFRDEQEAEDAAQKMVEEKRVNALPQTPESWRIAVEMNALLLCFVPESLKTKRNYPRTCTLFNLFSFSKNKPHYLWGNFLHGGFSLCSLLHSLL